MTSTLIKPTKHYQWRMLKDFLARYGVALGGSSVIIAIVLIFFYLLYVVLPMFVPASIEKIAQYDFSAVQDDATAHLALEEQNKVATHFTKNGTVRFFDSHSGKTLNSTKLSFSNNATILSFAKANLSTGVVAYGSSNGQALVVRQKYTISYPDDVQTVTPELQYPLGKTPIEVDAQGRGLVFLAIQSNTDQTTIAAITDDSRLVILQIKKEESFLDDEVSLQHIHYSLQLKVNDVYRLLLDKEQLNLYLITKSGLLTLYDLSDAENPVTVLKKTVTEGKNSLTGVEFLTGDLSLLIADTSGKLSQWFSVKDESNNLTLQQIRKFKRPKNPALNIASEQRRKGFVVTDANGFVGIFHTTSHRTLLHKNISSSTIEHIALSPRANAFLALNSEHQIQLYKIKNEHPEISWSAIWNEIWYESYPEPAYIWQSSSASSDFEPKLSLTPLVFGTLKAAFYAMMFAIPLAILGAIFTAYFMAPRMRRIVKPSIEIMEALPTVIIGFLAGLWLAPIIEHRLAGVLCMLIIVPFGVLFFAYLWRYVPAKVRHKIPDGWQAALLIPVLIILTWFAMAIAEPMEMLLFSGNLREWLQSRLGINYDQRNALVVGMAMGFAVIPTIFSIAEDAIFSVPKHLSNGSLALGATTWQTLTRVVLLTASPGIFSAVMIGLGRAVGETMIVLMATGNTPVLDFSIFQGMRTLAANIAVEMPESEVDSSHYRILFLAAFVLFAFTFLFNTIAELIRHRLRVKYSSL